MDRLTGKQRMFVAEYLVDLNATRAAIRAGYDAGIPSGLSHIVVAVRLDGSAALFGFTDGCRTGIANLLPGVHREIYGQEVEAPGAGS